MVECCLEAAERDRTIDKHKAGLKSKAQSVLLLYKERIRCADTGGFTQFIQSDFMI